MNPVVARWGQGKRNAEPDGPPEIDDIGAYADHVVKFSLAGMRALREAVEEKHRGLKGGEKSATLKTGAGNS
jgi:hypothetical protein